ncbi:MAG: YdcF family protein [Kiritimatiellae bacterium]|nr:YdcF family protein [Kiritimatiellia bacterium]
MYYLNKAVGFVISPIGIAIFGGLVALLCAMVKRQRMAKWLGGLSVAWLWLWMTPAMTWIVGVPLEKEFLVDGKVPTVETFPEVDAIVLLGGSMGIETNLSQYAEMWTSADRVWQAARLYRAEKATKIIATGNYAIDTTLPLLKEFGVGEEAVSFLDARTTEEEAKGLWEMLVKSVGVEELGVEEFGEPDSPTHPIKHSSTARPKVLLVTSAWHMKRARLMFKKYAPDIGVVCAPADFENMFMAEKTPLFKLLLPDPNVFMLNSVSFHEWVGIVGYKVFR